MKATELKGDSRDLKRKILKSKNTRFYVESPVSFNRLRISKEEASESVFLNLSSDVIFSDYNDGILITRKTK